MPAADGGAADGGVVAGNAIDIIAMDLVKNFLSFLVGGASKSELKDFLTDDAEFAIVGMSMAHDILRARGISSISGLKQKIGMIGSAVTVKLLEPQVCINKPLIISNIFIFCCGHLELPSTTSDSPSRISSGFVLSCTAEAAAAASDNSSNPLVETSNQSQFLLSNIALFLTSHDIPKPTTTATASQYEQVHSAAVPPANHNTVADTGAIARTQDAVSATTDRSSDVPVVPVQFKQFTGDELHGSSLPTESSNARCGVSNSAAAAAAGPHTASTAISSPSIGIHPPPHPLDQTSALPTLLSRQPIPPHSLVNWSERFSNDPSTARPFIHPRQESTKLFNTQRSAQPPPARQRSGGSQKLRDESSNFPRQRRQRLPRPQNNSSYNYTAAANNYIEDEGRHSHMKNDSRDNNRRFHNQQYPTGKQHNTTVNTQGASLAVVRTDHVSNPQTVSTGLGEPTGGGTGAAQHTVNFPDGFLPLAAPAAVEQYNRGSDASVKSKPYNVAAAGNKHFRGDASDNVRPPHIYPGRGRVSSSTWIPHWQQFASTTSIGDAEHHRDGQTQQKLDSLGESGVLRHRAPNANNSSEFNPSQRIGDYTHDTPAGAANNVLSGPSGPRPGRGYGGLPRMRGKLRSRGGGAPINTAGGRGGGALINKGNGGGAPIDTSGGGGAPVNTGGGGGGNHKGHIAATFIPRHGPRGIGAGRFGRGGIDLHVNSSMGVSGSGSGSLSGYGGMMRPVHRGRGVRWNPSGRSFN